MGPPKHEKSERLRLALFLLLVEGFAMSIQELISRVGYQLQVARNTVQELETIRDKLVDMRAEAGLAMVEDDIPGIGPMKRSAVYVTALRNGCKRVNPSYEDQSGEIWTLFHGSDYIRFANKFGLGKIGRSCVLLTLTESHKVRQAIRADRGAK